MRQVRRLGHDAALRIRDSQEAVRRSGDAHPAIGSGLVGKLGLQWLAREGSTHQKDVTNRLAGEPSPLVAGVNLDREATTTRTVQPNNRMQRTGQWVNHRHRVFLNLPQLDNATVIHPAADAERCAEKIKAITMTRSTRYTKAGKSKRGGALAPLEKQRRACLAVYKGIS
jgi:hypothetical protein